LATFYKNIDLVYTDMGEYSKALSSHEKALASSHSDLATAYNDMGLVYYQMDNYRKLFSFYERAVDIGQRSLFRHDPCLWLWNNSRKRVNKKL
jgi:tetratricopeptide (TPR) repeat protein